MVLSWAKKQRLVLKMYYEIPGKKSTEVLKKGPLLSRGGMSYFSEAEDAEKKGFQVKPPQFINGKAEGSWIYDLDGNRYMDFHAGWASNPFGNSNPEIIEAVYSAMKTWGFSYEHPLQYELAEVLAEITPGQKLTRVNFEISGTEAAEAAVSTALVHKERPLIIAFEDSFHGDSIGARGLSALTSDRSKYFESWRGGVIHVPYPHTFDIPAGMNAEQYADYILWYIDEFVCRKVVSPDMIAGILLEPCMAEGGNWIPTDNFITGIQEVARKHDWLIIADEVLVGLGRTGKMWAVDHWNFIPDLLVIGKNLSGGVEPIAAIAGTEEVMRDTEVHSGSTYAGSPAGCAAALKTLEMYKRDKIVERTENLGKKVMERLNRWTQEFSIVGQVRGLGLLLGASIVDSETKKPRKDLSMAVYQEALKRGAWIINDDEANIRLYPALNVEEDALDTGLTAVEEALRAVEKKNYRVNIYPEYPNFD